MGANPTTPTWASVEFHPRGSPQPTEALRAKVRRVYRLQAEDDERLQAALPDVLARLDLSNRAVIAMTCDQQFSPLFENWVASCDRFGIDCRATTVVFPTDRGALERVERLGFIAYFDDDSQLLRELNASAGYGDAAWTDFMYHQNWVIKKLLELSADVLFQDVDLVWRQDPLPLLAEQAAGGADIQAMYDGPNSRFQPIYANSGFMYLRSTPSVRAFWDDVYACHDMVGYYRSQQEPLNVMLAAHARRGLTVRLLDESRFANGHLYCGGRTSPPDPWVVHNSWTEGLAEKYRRYVANDLWFLSEEPPVGSSVREAATGPTHREVEAVERRAVETSQLATQSREALLGLVGDLRRERDALRRALETTRSSTSWRITKPLRAARDTWLRMRRWGS